MKPIFLAVITILASGHVAAAEIKLEQIISRENPAFQCERARLCAGRDGKVYLASSATPGYVLRFDRDGRGKFGATVGYALTGVAANADGVLATAHAHFAHKVALYDKTWKNVVSVDPFLVDDRVGWDAPGHVEAGARDFFGLDQHRDRIVRLSALGKVLKSYVIPHLPDGKPGLVQDFRVCERRETLYLLARSGPIRCVGFDGAYALDGQHRSQMGGRVQRGWLRCRSRRHALYHRPARRGRVALQGGRRQSARASAFESGRHQVRNDRAPILRRASAPGRSVRAAQARVRTLPPVRSGQWRLPAGRPHGARAADGRVPDRHLDRGGAGAVPRPAGAECSYFRTARGAFGLVRLELAITASWLCGAIASRCRPIAPVCSRCS